MRMSRREFVKSATAGGIVLSLSRLATAEEPGFAARETLLHIPRIHFQGVHLKRIVDPTAILTRTVQV